MPRATQLPNPQRIAVSAISLHPQIARQVNLPKSMAACELVRRIRLTGDCDTVIVRPHPSGTAGQYELLTHPITWHAARAAELARVPAEVCTAPELPTQLQRLDELAADLRRNPIAMADTLQALLDLLPSATHQDLAWLSGQSRIAITHYLRLNELPEAVRRLLQQSRLSFNHGKLLCSRPLVSDPERQVQLARSAVQERWSTRRLQSAIDGAGHAPLNATRTHKPRAAAAMSPALVDDPNIRRLAQSLSEITGQPVQIEHQVSGEGRIVIRYHSLDELEGALRFFPLPS